ncbi:MAG: transcriptional repressor LexA [Actinomycetia bacterium]|nr:transcriptional repressor LexA [Actinomycetes bacterium]
MKEIKITKRQKTVLEKIKNFMMENSYPPTIRDIAREFGFSSPKAVTDHLKSLERKGFIERNSLARSIKLTGKALDMLDGLAAWRNDGRGYPPNLPNLPSRLNLSNLHSFANPESAGIIYLPLVGKVAAGNPILAQENISEYIPVSSSLFGAKKADFALKVKGDSMTGDHILDGDIIIARSQNTADNGDIVVALIGDEAVVKKIYRSKDKVELRSSNPAYLPIEITASSGDQVNESSQGSKNLIIQGKVIAVQREIK